jgi:thiamine pyrophosphate-dependent acetolactate synthase large subunit-like protein
LPGLDIATIARGFGVEAYDVASACELPQAYERAFRSALSRPGPVLLNVTVDSTVSAIFGQPQD